MTTPAYDKDDQLEKIRAGLLDGEQIICVYDAIGAGTGFIDGVGDGQGELHRRPLIATFRRVSRPTQVAARRRTSS